MFANELRCSGSLVGLLILVGASGCSSEPEVPPQPAPDAGVVPAPAPTPAPTTTTQPGLATGPCDATMQLALQTAIREREKQLDHHMKAEGAFACQTINEGETVRLPVTLQPGKCYSVLAHSFPNITDIDLFLKPNLGPNPPPLLAMFAGTVIAQDSETGPTASIGGGKNCFKNPLPFPGAGVVEVVAKQGGGPVAVQVYSK